MGLIPRRLEGMEKIQKEAKDFLGQLAHGIDQMFDKAHLGFVPEPVRYLVCATLVLSPLLVVCFMLFMDDEEIPSAPAKVAPPKGKRDKIE